MLERTKLRCNGARLETIHGMVLVFLLNYLCACEGADDIPVNPDASTMSVLDLEKQISELLAQRKYTEALPFINSIILKSRTGGKYFIERAECYANLGRIDEAIYDYMNARNNSIIFFVDDKLRLIELLFQAKRYTEGVHAMKQLPYRIIVEMVKKLGVSDRLEAIHATTRAIERNPSDSPYYALRGICFIEIGNMDDGIEDLKTALSLESYEPDGKNFLLDALLQSERFGEAIDEVLDCSRMSEYERKMVYKLADNLCSSKKFEEAINLFKKALAKFPTFHESNYYGSLGTCFIKMEKPDEAMLNFEEAARTDGQLSQMANSSRIFLSFALFDAGKHDNAVKEMACLNDIQLIILGDKLFKAKRFREADLCYTKAIEDNSENATECYKKRAYCQQEMGKLDEALRYFQTVLELNPSNIEYRLDLVRALINVKKYQEAKNEMSKISSTEYTEYADKQEIDKLNEIINYHIQPEMLST